MTESNYAKLRSIDCSAKIEKKNGLSYLSWPFAVDQLLLKDEKATWTYGEPVKFGETVMVFCTVTAFDKSMTSQLPVMDHRNKAIQNPDAFAVNTAMQRCLVKAIALHGIGLYIYAGEDLPGSDPDNGFDTQQEKPHEEIARRFLEALRKDYAGATEEVVELQRAHAVLAVQQVVSGDEALFSAAWKLLDAADRKAIKAYVALARGK